MKLFYLITLILCIFPTCKSRNSSNDSKIKIANPDEVDSDINSKFFTDYVAKSTVRIQTFKGSCSGTIIAKDIVATAAHCFSSPKGSGGFVALNGMSVPISSYEKHEYYSKRDSGLAPYDVAIARTSSSLIDIGGVPVPLVSGLSPVLLGTPVYTAGFGVGGGRSDPQNEANYRKLQLKEFKLKWSGVLTEEIEAKDNRKTGGMTCSGDSGGPSYIWKDNKLVLFGITSGGADCTTAASFTASSVRYFNSWFAAKAQQPLSYAKGFATKEQYLAKIPKADKKICGNLRMEKSDPTSIYPYIARLFVDAPIVNPPKTEQKGIVSYILRENNLPEKTEWIRQQGLSGNKDYCFKYATHDDNWGECPDCDGPLKNFSKPEHSSISDWIPEDLSYEFSDSVLNFSVPTNLLSSNSDSDNSNRRPSDDNANNQPVNPPTGGSKGTFSKVGMCVYAGTTACSACDNPDLCDADPENPGNYNCWQKGRRFPGYVDCASN